MKYLESPDVASVVSLETTLTQADSSLMQILKNMSSGSNAFKVKKDDSGLDYTVELPKLAQQQGVVTSDESAFYKDKAGNEVAIRLTQLVGDKELGEFSLKSKKFKYTQSEYVAREHFKQQGKDQGDRPASEITDTVLMNGKETTYQELVQALEKVFTEQRTYGKMVHAFIQYKLEVDPVKKEAAKLLANSYALQVGLPFVTLETHPELSQYELEFDKVLKTAGIRLEGVLPDKVIPEISLVSKNIKDSAGRFIGTTLDSLIQHSNADVSLIDWKTGSLLSDAMSTRIMQYADNVQVSDTKLNRAYLELAFRALILKEHFPKMRFRKVAVVSLSKKGNHSLMTVDLAPFLTIIGNYYRETNPQIYQQLLDSKLLNVESYLGTKGEVMKALPSALHHVPLEEQMSFLQARIDSIMLGSTAEEIKKSPTLSADLKMYTEALLELKKQPGMDLDQKTDDIPSVTGLIKNFSDIANPKVQVLHKELLKARHESSNRMQEITKEHDRLSLEVIKEATSSTARTMRKVLALPLLYSIVTLNPGVLVGSIATGLILRRFGKNTKDVFGFMWKKSTAPGREGYFLNTTNEHEGKPLTPAQRAYRDHYTRTMRSIYTEVMSEVVAYSPSGKPITRAEANAKPIDLPDDFMPRVAASLSEIRENESYLKGFLGLQTHVKYFAQRHLSDYVEDTYTSQDGQQALPVKYFGHTGSKTVLKANHSFDPTKAFKLFVGNLIYKQNFDQLYNMAQGVKNALDMETDEAGNARYPNLTKWLDNEVYAQILQTPKPSRFTTRKWTYKVGVLGSKILDLPVGYHIEISQEKVINLARTSTTYLIMGFKLASAIRNGMLITVLNTMNATKATMAQLMGIPPEDYRPTAKGTFAAFKDLKDFYALKLQGREEESKLWNLAKKFDWLPDNYPYSQDPKDFFSESIRFSLNSYTFSFHNMVETYGALAQLSMLMRTMQLTNDKGEKFSAWEAYSMKDGDLTWTKGKRGQVQEAEGVFKDLTELDINEIKNLRRAYEKLQGSYRTEEKTAIEATVMGSFLFQFKKYFFQYMKNLVASPYVDRTVGRYIIDKDITRPDGVPVYKWESEVMEGRLKVMASALSAGVTTLTGFINKDADPAKEWRDYWQMKDFDGTSLKASRRKHMMELLNTLLWMAGLFVFYITMFPDDDDKKTPMAKYVQRIGYDASMGLNPKDLFESMKKPVVALDRIPTVGTALWDFFTEGVTGKTTREGWPIGLKTILRNTPGASAALQVEDILSDYDWEGDDSLLKMIED